MRKTTRETGFEEKNQSSVLKCVHGPGAGILVIAWRTSHRVGLGVMVVEDLKGLAAHDLPRVEALCSVFHLHPSL